MAEKLSSKNASPATSSKLAGNPAFRMMGRSRHRRPASTYIHYLRLIQEIVQDYPISNSGCPLVIGLSSGL